MKCHGFGPHKLNNGIYNSCNTYFANVYLKTIAKYAKPAYADVWSDHVKSFGLGDFLGYDFLSVKNIPDSKTYKKIYPNGGWRAQPLSNSIGQVKF
jgi:penicillin-binding protein 2